ncbi:hypothetical protein BKA67DRAFT_672536 [Truncatella angustata]|uniref:Uncharacterized protein n=1 Tax=Truncatella angustata TaxID=152316 RepID=A0A9P8ZZ39_9PEZI|nr:uncharacterized protein BKA67DRAFT_672536 [Truncatella angustata]KAH6656792.1 hypothetical protein BKA67DRAFT_672536 [Truncatella angustata]KAH8197886.1 hypothetical protein TruAng_007938 [Truncatella angustata]
MVTTPTFSGLGPPEQCFSTELKTGPTPQTKMVGHDQSHQPREISPDKSGRSSFSSVRENDSDLAQTFTSTKVSSYLKEAEQEDQAIDDLPSPLDMATCTKTQFRPPLTQPHSRLHGNWLPAVAADGFQGWKQIGVKGKTASRSFGDLQALRIVWSAPATQPKPKSPGRPLPGHAPIEQLPLELLGSIIEHLILDIPPNGISARNVDLMSLLVTSKTLHTATLNALYRNITIPHSRIFRKFLNHISANQELGTVVRRLDFSHFNPQIFFSTASERLTTQNLTPETLLKCLELTPYLREFLAQEYIDEEISEGVLKKLFFRLERLQAIDFTGCHAAPFKDAMSSLVAGEWPETLSILRLSFHKCTNLPSEVFSTMLPRLAQLTHLDVAGTRITDEALLSIPHTARLSHLNLAKCKLLTAEGVVDFITNHPAAKELVFLSLAADATSHQLLEAEDVTALLPHLPATLRSLSLKGSIMDATHIDMLRPLAKHLEELSLGRRMKISDVERIFRPDENDDDYSMEIDWVPHSLKYIDLSDYTTSELDLSSLLNRRTSILEKYSAPLEVVEVSEDAYKRLAKSSSVERCGWTVTEFGNRAWLVRKQAAEDDQRDSGLRSWKSGASFWGMRKIPMAKQEVGGMYGSYMFKRKL